MPPASIKVDGVRIANVYQAATEDGLLAMDTGMTGKASRFLSFVEGLGRKPDDFRDIVLTRCTSTTSAAWPT